MISVGRCSIFARADIVLSPEEHRSVSVPETMMIHSTDAYMRHRASMKYTSKAVLMIWYLYYYTCHTFGSNHLAKANKGSVLTVITGVVFIELELIRFVLNVDSPLSAWDGKLVKLENTQGL